MYMCVINNWVVWNMENMCNCKEITLITHEITSSQNSITEPEKPLTKGNKEIPPVMVKWGVLFVYNIFNIYFKDEKRSKAICIRAKLIMLKNKGNTGQGSLVILCKENPNCVSTAAEIRRAANNLSSHPSDKAVHFFITFCSLKNLFPSQDKMAYFLTLTWSNAEPCSEFFCV